MQTTTSHILTSLIHSSHTMPLTTNTDQLNSTHSDSTSRNECFTVYGEKIACA